jgi:HEPN domain-containing protein
MNKEIAYKWYKQAKHDLLMAEKNVSIEGYDIASFLAQQSVEKLLKSIIALEGKNIPKTHYLDDLSRLLGISGEILNDVLDLTADYMFSRYPDVGDRVPYEEYDIHLAKEKVGKAKRIFDYLKIRYKQLSAFDSTEKEGNNG